MKYFLTSSVLLVAFYATVIVGGCLHVGWRFKNLHPWFLSFLAVFSLLSLLCFKRFGRWRAIKHLGTGLIVYWVMRIVTIGVIDIRSPDTYTAVTALVTGLTLLNYRIAHKYLS